MNIKDCLEAIWGLLCIIASVFLMILSIVFGCSDPKIFLPYAAGFLAVAGFLHWRRV